MRNSRKAGGLETARHFLTILCVLSVASSGGAPYVHLVLVPHVYCQLHHRFEGTTPASRDQPNTDRGPRGQNGSRQHTCTFAVQFGTPFGPLSPLSSVCAPQPFVRAVQTQPVVLSGSTLRVVSFAPKHSPPLA